MNGKLSDDGEHQNWGGHRPLFCHLTVPSKEQLKFNIDQEKAPHTRESNQTNKNLHIYHDSSKYAITEREL